MAERLLLEGGDLSELMEYVRAEYGPHARIVRADRVRSGGFAGFFAKEKYELTIDVPAMPPVRPLRSHRAPAPASALTDLLDAADAADASDAPPRPDPQRARAAIDAAPQTAARAATPRAATGGAQFATVLDQVRSLADDGLPTEAFVPTQGRSGDGGTPAVEPGAPVGGLATPARGIPTVPVAGPPAAAAPVPAPSGAVLRAALTGLGVPVELLGGSPLLLADVLDRIPQAPALPRRAGEILTLVGAATDLTMLEPLLLDRMRLGRADVVHVGPGLRFDPGLPGPDRPTRITSAQGLSAWRARAPMARHPWLVLIPVDGDADDRTEAAEQAAASRPTQYWAVVDARTKARDAVSWLEQVGSRLPVDAVAVRALLDTSAPGTVLGLGRPVAWVDGMPTSRVVWAAVLGQPLDAALAAGDRPAP